MTMEDSMLVITDELREAALKQVQEMKESEISRRTFTTAMRNVVLNEENREFKPLVDDCLSDKIETWTTDEEELQIALDTYMYGVKKLMNPTSKVTADDYAEILTAKVIFLSLDSKNGIKFGRTNAQIMGIAPDGDKFSDDIIIKR